MIGDSKEGSKMNCGILLIKGEYLLILKIRPTN